MDNRLNRTLEYYNSNSQQFFEGTVSADMSETRERFLKYVSDGGSILDFGCGSGRDSKAFGTMGYRVNASDGSKDLCRMAAEYAGIEVRCEEFMELSDCAMYDGIWACASILHLTREEMPAMLRKLQRALKPGGVLYTSYKYGDFEGMRNGRYFTNYTEKSLVELVDAVPGLRIIDMWITGDVRPGRDEERWLNVICDNNYKELTAHMKQGD